jgi:cobalamin synthase
VNLVGFIIRIYHDAQSSECQICEITLLSIHVHLNIAEDNELGSMGQLFFRLFSILGCAALCRSHTKQRCGLPLASVAVPAAVVIWFLLGCPAWQSPSCTLVQAICRTQTPPRTNAVTWMVCAVSVACSGWACEVGALPYCYVCPVLYTLFSSRQLPLFSYPDWGFSVLFPQL